MTARRHRLLPGLAALALSLSPMSGCTCADSTEPPPAPTLAPAAPAPAGLAFELVVRAPSTLLTEVREAMAGPMLLLPKSVGGMAVNLFGLPITAAELIDEQLPIVGAGLTDDRGERAVVHTAFAIHVKDGRRFVAHLTQGPDATFDAKSDGDLVWLTAKDNLREARLPAELAVVTNYLVVGDGERAVSDLGPYLATNLARAEPSKADLVVTVKNTAALAARLEHLKAPAEALALPGALGTVLDLPGSLDAARELLEQVGSAEVVVDLDPAAALVVEASLDARGPIERAALATLPEISPSRMLTLPDGTVGAMQWGEPAGGRADDAGRRAATISDALGLTEDDQASLRSALTAMGEGRGERSLVGLRCTGVGLTGMAEGDVRDDDALTSAVASLTAMAERPSVKGRLDAERMTIDVSVGRARHIPDDVHLVRFSKTPEADRPTDETPPPIDLRYVIAADRFYAAAGAESLLVLQHLHQPDPERRWASSSPSLESAIGRLGSSAWLAVAADPHALNACLHGKPGGTFSTPATFVVAPAPTGATARLELAAGLLRVVGRELF